MSKSIQNRLLVTTTCVLGLFLTLTGWILDRSFSASVVAGAEEQLRLVIYSLMGSVEERDGQLLISDNLSEPRLTQPESGLYAKVSDDLATSLWLSPSAVTTGVPFPEVNTEPGLFVFTQVQEPLPRFYLSYTVFWEGVDAEQVVFSVATDQLPFRASIRQFRRSLGIGFGAATLVFIFAQLLALRWGLLPLRTMAEEVHALESGERDALSNGYPRELQGLAHNLDRFVQHEKRSRSRYRNALEDLAHSLKTPLAVVRNSLLDARPDRSLLQDQLDRMENTVHHQLTRASATGPVVVGKSVVLAQVVERLVVALQTAYVDRGIEIEQRLDRGVSARGDDRDFLEMFGNLLENAFKYTRSVVRVTTQAYPPDDDGAQSTDARQAWLIVEDDGPGIPPALRDEVLNRGRRLDEIQSGQGIGLAVVAELVALYEGLLEIESSELGGARISVCLPAGR